MSQNYKINSNSYIIEVELKGGLCNKLFSLSSALLICINNNYKLLEPYFGWDYQILFSEIYNIEFFNTEFKKYFNYEIMVPFKEKNNYNIVKEITHDELWEYSEKNMSNCRKTSIINKESIILLLLQFLVLNDKYLKYIDSCDISKLNAIHIRIEKDWINDEWVNNEQNKLNKSDSNELYMIDEDDLIDMYYDFSNKHDIFFTLGEKQEQIKNKFKNKGINSEYFFNKDLEYEINGAINFTLCSMANKFIGTTRSTFSNLITLKRFLLKNDNSYIYNYSNKIRKRIDKGIHCEPVFAIGDNVKVY